MSISRTDPFMVVAFDSCLSLFWSCSFFSWVVRLPTFSQPHHPMLSLMTLSFTSATTDEEIEQGRRKQEPNRRLGDTGELEVWLPEPFPWTFGGNERNG